MNPTQLTRIAENRCKECGVARDNETQMCTTCRTHHKKCLKEYDTKFWGKRAVRASRWADRQAEREIREADFITPEFLKKLQTFQANRCAYCTIELQCRERCQHDGLSVQRLDNSEAHHKRNCILACRSCNSKRMENLTAERERYLTGKRALVAWNRQKELFA